MNEHSITLDLDKAARLARRSPVTLRQGDRHGCAVTATVTDHGEPFDATGLDAYVVIGLPSGAYYRDSAQASGGTVTATIDETRAATEACMGGVGYFEFRDGDEVIATTQNFPVRCIPSAVDGYVPEPYDAAIADAISRCDDAAARVEDVIDGAAEMAVEAAQDAVADMAAEVAEALADTRAATSRATAAAEAFEDGASVLTTEQIDAMF